MGELVTYQLGTMPEPSADILKRIANDPESLDLNTAQLEGKYFYAQTPATWARRFRGSRTRSSV